MTKTVTLKDMRMFIDLVRQENELLAGTGGVQPAALVRTFGCQQNVSDSEKLKGMLAEMGYRFTDSLDEADLVLYNTCAVRENAEDRVFGNAGALKGYKARNPALVAALCGCMVQQPHIAEKLRESYAHIDLVFGTHALYRFPQLLYEKLSGNRRRVYDIEQCDGVIVEDVPLRRDGTVRAWLPVMYGCNNFCTYCVVPFVRGRERSRKPDKVLEEARGLVAKGYKEITLLGQNVNSYGKTLDRPLSFAALLCELCKIDGDFLLRFMTSHPKDCNKELIDVIAENPKIAKHLHLPVQSGSDRVLASMNRGYTAAQYLELIDYAREKCPGITFTSDIIVGFPGETEQDFQQTLELVKRVEYLSLFTFLYSRREGTRAAAMPDPVPHEEKMRWFNELLDVQNEIGGRHHASMLGRTVRVLVEGPGKTQEGYLAARTEGNIIVEFPGDMGLVGRFVPVRVTKALKWALIGEQA